VQREDLERLESTEWRGRCGSSDSFVAVINLMVGLRRTLAGHEMGGNGVEYFGATLGGHRDVPGSLACHIRVI